MQIIINIFLLLISFYLLAVIVDEFFVESLDKLSKRLKLSSEVAGATLMAIGSSAPELFTSLIAALHITNQSDIGAGTIVGSAIFNILVIIGASAMYRKAKLTWQPVIRDLLFYCVAILALLFSFQDGVISLPEALSFVAMYIIYVVAVGNWAKWLKYKLPEDPKETLIKETSKNPVHKMVVSALNKIFPDPNERYLTVFGISIMAIGILSYLMVESAVALATTLHISPAIVGLTILAAGTSVPDLMASMIVAKTGRGDMAIANAVGSNIFDTLFGLGVPWTLSIILRGEIVTVATENLLSSIFLLFATVIAVFFVLAAKKWEIGRRAGILLIVLYLCYVLYNVVQVI